MIKDLKGRTATGKARCSSKFSVQMRRGVESVDCEPVS